MKVGIGFLGLGHVHVWDRAGAAAENKDVEILGAYDPDEAALEKFCSTYQVKPRGLSELLDDDDIRLIYVVGRTYESPAYIISALEHHKHVLVEKPGSPSLKEMNLVVAKAEKASTLVRVGYSWEFLPTYADIRSVLASNTLGKITFARVHMGYPSGALLKDFFCWPHSPGGVFYETVCHSLNLLLLFFGKPFAVTGRIEKYAMGTHPFEDVGVGVLEYPDRLVSIDLCGWEANDFGENHRFEIYGTEGTLFFGFKPPRYELFLKEDVAPFNRGWNVRESPPYTTAYCDDLARMLELVQSGDAAACLSDLRRAQDIIAVLEGIYRSAAAKGKSVRISPSI